MRPGPAGGAISMGQTRPSTFVVGRSMIAHEIPMGRHLFRVPRLRLALLIVVLISPTLSCVTISLDGGPVPTPAFPIESLLLDESAFPEGWYLPTGQPFDPRAGFGLRTALTFSPPGSGGIALHEASVARDPEEAAEGYEEWGQFWFSNREGNCIGGIPAELQYQSPVADQFRLGCCIRQQEGGVQTCQAVARYGRYLIRFHTYMNPESMTFTDLERILTAIDERMVLYLGKDTH